MNIPNREFREEFRRSWKILLTSAIGAMFGPTGVSFYSFSIFILPLESAFGWSLSSITVWYIIYGIGGIISAPLSGIVADRFGVRRLFVIGIPIFSILVASIGLSQGNLILFYVTTGVLGGIGACIGTINYARVINSWFDVARGRALGLMTAGVSMGSIFGPRLLQAVIDATNWRYGFVFSGFLTLMVTPLVFLFLREQRHSKKNIEVPSYDGSSLREATSLPIFWLMVGAILMCSIGAGATVHVVPALVERGFEPSTASAYVGTIGLSSLLGRLISGVLMDKIWARAFVPILLSIQSVGFILLISIGNKYVYVPLVIIGFGFGLEADYIPFVISRHFGLRAYSSIFGTMTAIAGAVSMLFPFIFGRIREATNSYAIPFLIAGLFSLGGAIMFYAINNYAHLRQDRTTVDPA